MGAPVEWNDCYNRLIKEMIFIAIFFVPCSFKWRPFLPKWKKLMFELSRSLYLNRFSFTFKFCIIWFAILLSDLTIGIDNIISDSGNALLTSSTNLLISRRTSSDVFVVQSFVPIWWQHIQVCAWTSRVSVDIYIL